MKEITRQARSVIKTDIQKERRLVIKEEWVGKMERERVVERLKTG